MGLTVNRLAFSLTPNSTMETSGAKRKIEQDSENVTPAKKPLKGRCTVFWERSKCSKSQKVEVISNFKNILA